MFRRCFLTAAAAVAIALVAPSTSKADFTVTLQGLTGGQQISGNILSVTNSSTLGLLPPFGNPGGTVGNLAGITGTGSGANLAIGFPSLSFTTPVGNAVGLAGTTPFSGSSDPAGVYVGASFSQSQSVSTASVISTSNIYVVNNTSGTETITLTVLGNFTLPGSAGSTLSVLDKLTDLGFQSFTGTAPTSSDSISFFGTADSPPDGPVSSGTLSFTGADIVGSTFNNFSFADNGAYSLQQTVTITLAAGDAVSFQARMDDSVVTAPAPNGFIMGLAGIPFLGLGLLRRRMGRAVPTVA
jgi:hypothetical protein